jgi:hypothetical protein
LLDGGTVFYRFLRAEVRTVPGAATLFASLSREEHLACGLSLVLPRKVQTYLGRITGANCL